MDITFCSFVILAFTIYKICATEVESIECGTINFTRGLTWNGKEIDRGEWPFLTALFKVKEEEENEFLCGGTLISSKHVLIAAHCIQDKRSGKKLLPGNISVLIGAYDFTSNAEIGVQQRDVKEIHVQPEWELKSDKYDADLAILLLSRMVYFTDYIRPLDISADETVIDDFKVSAFYWGLKEIETKANTEFIKLVFVSVINGYFCLTTVPKAAVISSQCPLCGRGEDGNPSRSDSSGGFFVENKDSVWVQNGIVSALDSNLNRKVDADSVVVFTNVGKFKKWIVDTVMESEDKLVKLNLECAFGYLRTPHRYTCRIDNLDILSDNIQVTSFSGSHLNQETDQDVESISFRNGTMFFIPSGVGEIFQNLRHLRILQNLSTKRIKRSDFKSFQNLVNLTIFQNDITILDYDTFRDLQQLEGLSIVENRLTEIEEGTFETNIKLKKVFLYRNKLEVLPRNVFQNNLFLDIVILHHNSMRIIDESTFETNTKLKIVELQGNKLEVLPRKLFQNNVLLEFVNLEDNRLRIIDTDFTSLSNMKQIFFYHNICIDAYYEGDDPKIYRNQFRNLTEFHNLIRANCSSLNP